MALDDLVKRTMDVVGSSVGMIILSPAYFIIAGTIAFVDGSPIIHRQLRYGQDGKPFEMYKFRTMKEDYPPVSRQAISDDNLPRYTITGMFLRRTRLNELPQLYNVLKGDMSLVGPRPVLVSDDETDVYTRRLNEARMATEIRSIKPGVTGYTQLVPDDLSVEDTLQRDLDYLSRKSFLEDLRIIGRTALYLLRFYVHKNG